MSLASRQEARRQSQIGQWPIKGVEAARSRKTAPPFRTSQQLACHVRADIAMGEVDLN